MTKKLFFLPLIAAVVLTGCSSDDVQSDEPVTPTDDSAGYIAVSLKATNGTSGRDTTADDFEDGTAEESKAETGVFMFFDASGNQTQIPQTVTLTWTGQGHDIVPSVSDISEAVIVVAGNTKPTQMMVVLNPLSDYNYTYKTISELRAIYRHYQVSRVGGFIMTNSTYKDGDATICAAAIDPATQVFKTADEAAASTNKVEVFVERVMAKVQIDGLKLDDDQHVTTDGMTITPSDMTISGKEITLTPTIEGIEIANQTARSYLFKNIDGITGWDAFTDPANKRSYWATCPKDVTYDNTSWKATSDATDELTYYISENTTKQKSSILLTATLHDAEGNTPSFVYWAGNYYEKDAFLDQYAQNLKNAGYLIQNNVNSFATITKDNLEWLSKTEHAELVASGKLKAYQTTVKFKGNATITKDGSAHAESSVDELNATLLDSSNLVWLWEDGKCYYFANIEHFGPVSAGYNEGVVRNHIYKLNLQSLKGVGVPVPFEEETIIPEKPTDELFYIAAQINILKWRIVSQDVNFE
jgi:hypothetical protein